MSWPWVFFLHQFICNPFQSNLCNESVTAETETDWAEVQVILNIIMIFYRNYSNRNTTRSLGRNRKGIYILSLSRATPPLVSTAASVVSAAADSVTLPDTSCQQRRLPETRQESWITSSPLVFSHIMFCSPQPPPVKLLTLTSAKSFRQPTNRSPSPAPVNNNLEPSMNL